MNATVAVATTLVIAGALYIRLRWSRSPRAYQAMIASEATSARDEPAGVAWAMREMSEVGDPDYVQCRGAAILAEAYAHPELTPADLFERERQACLDARGFVLGLVPLGSR